MDDMGGAWGDPGIAAIGREVAMLARGTGEPEARPGGGGGVGMADPRLERCTALCHEGMARVAAGAG